jgi:hypothetical protein
MSDRSGGQYRGSLNHKAESTGVRTPVTLSTRCQTGQLERTLAIPSTHAERSGGQHWGLLLSTCTTLAQFPKFVILRKKKEAEQLICHKENVMTRKGTARNKDNYYEE